MEIDESTSDDDYYDLRKSLMTTKPPMKGI